MAGQRKCLWSSSSRLRPAECARHRSRAVSTSVCRMRSDDAAVIASTKATKARFSDSWSGGRVDRRLNSSVEMTDPGRADARKTASVVGTLVGCPRTGAEVVQADKRQASHRAAAGSRYRELRGRAIGHRPSVAFRGESGRSPDDGSTGRRGEGVPTAMHRTVSVKAKLGALRKTYVLTVSSGGRGWHSPNGGAGA